MWFGDYRFFATCCVVVFRNLILDCHLRGTLDQRFAYFCGFDVHVLFQMWATVTCDPLLIPIVESYHVLIGVCGYCATIDVEFLQGGFRKHC